MTNSRFVSFKEVIEGIYAETGFQNIDWSNAVRLMGRFIELLGSYKCYIQKVTNGINGNPEPLYIENYSVEIPRDMFELQAIRELNSKIPLIYASNLFHLTQSSSIYDNEYIPKDWSDFFNLTQDEVENNPTKAMEFYSWHNRYIREKTSLLGEMYVDAPEWSRDRANMPVELKYILNNGTIFTNFTNKYLEVSYLAYPMDAEGFPMILDSEKVKRAAEAYILERILYKQYLTKGSVMRQQWRDSLQEKAFAIASAKSYLNTLSIDEAESLKNSQTRLIVDFRAHSNSFNTLNVEERRLP